MGLFFSPIRKLIILNRADNTPILHARLGLYSSSVARSSLNLGSSFNLLADRLR